MGVVGGLVVGLVVGDKADGDAPVVGGDEGVLDGDAVEAVEGGVDGGGGIVEAVQQGLLQLRLGGAGGGGGDVGGEESGRVAAQGQHGHAEDSQPGQQDE